MPEGQSGTEQGKEGQKPSNQDSNAGQKGSGENQNLDQAGSGDLDDSGWDEKTRKYIEKLRNENASHRTKNKDLSSKITSAAEREKALKVALGIEDESDSPEKKIEGLTANLDAVTFRNAVLQTALENGIASKDVDYLSYRIERETQKLEEGAELSEEQLESIIEDVRARAGGSKPANSSAGNSENSSKEKPPSKDAGGVTLDQFCAMSMMEKTKLYTTQPEVYKKLVEDAKRANRLI